MAKINYAELVKWRERARAKVKEGEGKEYRWRWATEGAEWRKKRDESKEMSE
jgi:hypothetical protein